MPGEPSRRSSRPEEHRRKAEADKDKVSESQPRRSSRIAEQQGRGSEPNKQEVVESYQGPDSPQRRAKSRQRRRSKPPRNQAQSAAPLEPAKTKKSSGRRKRIGVQKSPEAKQAPLNKKRRIQLPSERKASERPARESQPLLANETRQHPARSDLSHAALHQLQIITADDPFPEGIRPYKSALSSSDMPRSAPKANEKNDKEKATTVYSQTFVGELKERGVLDQRFEKNGFILEKPSNYDKIRSAIEKDRPHDRPSNADYKEYTEAVFSASNETEQKELYDLLFGISKPIKSPHLKQQDQRWLKQEPIIGDVDPRDCKQAPQPDLVEGFDATEIPRWIRKHLKGYAVPRAQLAFPNFLVELKRDKSMYTAHVQNRHCGAVASQAFVEYFVRLRKDPDLAWNIAKVGSVEFNGDIFVGNLHWASSPDITGRNRKSRQYHMTRVMCRFTYGLTFEDFEIACKEARNFREYFLGDRDEFLEECVKLPVPQIEGSLPVHGEGEEGSDDHSTIRGAQEPSHQGEPNEGHARKERTSTKRTKNQAAVKGSARAPKKQRKK